MDNMLVDNKIFPLLAVLVALAMFVTACDALEGILPPDSELPTREPGPEEPAPTQPPPEPQPTEPQPEPEPTEPPPEPEPTERPPEPEATTPPPPGPGPEQPEPGEQPSWDIGRLLTWGIALAVVVGIVIGVIIYFAGGRGGEEAPPELASVPITTVAQDIKEGRVSKIVVSGEDLTITRFDGLTLVSHKEPTADLVQLLTNLGVTPEMMSNIIIEVETPETPAR